MNIELPTKFTQAAHGGEFMFQKIGLRGHSLWWGSWADGLPIFWKHTLCGCLMELLSLLLSHSAISNLIEKLF